MNNYLARIKLALILTPAIYLPALWVLSLSSSPVLQSSGIVTLLLWGLLMSFGTAYAITLFISALRQHED